MTITRQIKHTLEVVALGFFIAGICIIFFIKSGMAESVAIGQQLKILKNNQEEIIKSQNTIIQNQDIMSGQIYDINQKLDQWEAE